MKYIDKSYSQEDINNIADSFLTKGFVKINSIFTDEFVAYIKSKTNESIDAPVDKYQSGFNRIAFDLFINDDVVLGLMNDDEFRNIMSTVTERKLFFTQALAFELEKNKSTGFPWHIGTQSFGYQQASDFGCTIWMPLDEINTSTQKGGMAYVPEDVISGRFMYEDADPAIAKHIEERHDLSENPELGDYLKLRDGILNDGSMKTLLDHFGVEDNYCLGDILLFNKNVIHRSVKLEEGKLDHRAAFVMRFIESDSTYDKKRALSLDFPRKLFDYKGCTSFHLDVCDIDKELISNSNYFKDHDTRHLTV